MIKGLVFGLAGLTMAFTCAHAGLLKEFSKEEATWTEEQLKRIPPAPDEALLQEFALAGEARHRYFIDTSSLSAGNDGVVRFTLAIKASGNRPQVSYAGIRCETKEWKTYAVASADGIWHASRRADWELIEPKFRDSFRSDLYRHYLCAGGAPAGESSGLALRLRVPPVPKERR